MPSVFGQEEELNLCLPSLLALWNPLIHQKLQMKRQKCKILQEKNTALVTVCQLSCKEEKSEQRHLVTALRTSQWVNSFSLVIQLTSSEGSAEEDFVDDVTEDFLAPSSWKGIVALLWRSVFIKHLLPRIKSVPLTNCLSDTGLERGCCMEGLSSMIGGILSLLKYLQRTSSPVQTGGGKPIIADFKTLH